MNADRYQRVKDVFFAACAEPVERRATYLNHVCAGDTSLRAAVEELLAHDQNPVSLTAMKFLRPHLEQMAQTGATDAPNRSIPLPARIGGFRILDTLGSGGMGVVYRAQQDHPHRIVALKVVTPGPPGHATASTLHRFELEAQMLARLKHPGIAHIYQAGTGDWGFGLQPYFAMELVNGRPLMQYVEQSALDTRHRLELFIQICDAVEHAHQRGIIHRDLKPANILLDESTSPVQPKVLDFGVARAIDSDLQRTTFRTTANQIIGTIAYMSPEQVSGDSHEVDTRSDVYSLGVVLYELLSGRLPHDLAGKPMAEAIHIVTHREPASLAITNRAMRGDLNTIVTRSMAHDKTRRYQTVRELARDVRHYLVDEPIEARRDSALYVLGKALRRYRVPVAALALIVCVVAVSAVVAWSLYVGQQRATKKALDAQQEIEDRLHESLILQARASRKNGMFDSRDAALEAVARAARINPTLDVRNEAIAAMALPGLKSVPFDLPERPVRAADSKGDICVLLNEDQSETVYRVRDGSIVAHIPPPRTVPTDFEAIQQLQLCSGYFARGYDVTGHPRRLEVWRIPEADLWMEFDDLPDRSRHRISPDESMIAIPQSDRLIHIYDLKSKQEIRRIAMEGDGGYLQFDPSGRWLARFHDQHSPVILHDLHTSEKTTIFNGVNIGWSLEWTPDGSMMAGADVQRIQLWDVAKQRLVGTLEGQSDVIIRLQFSPDGTLLASYSWNGEGILWDVRRRQPLLRMRALILGWHADGRRLVGRESQDGYPIMFEIQGGPEYSFLATRDAANAERSWQFVIFDPMGRFIFTGSESAPSLRVFEARTFREIGSADVGAIYEMRIDNAGRWLLTGDEHGTRLWPVTLIGNNLQVGPPQVIDSAEPGHHIDISHDGRLIVYASTANDPTFTIVDREQPSASRRFPHSPAAVPPRFSNDDRLLAIGNWGLENVEIWDVATCQRINELSTSGFTIVKFSPNGRVLATSARNEICLWDTRTWTRTSRLEWTHAGSLELSPDGSIIATVSITNQIRLIDARSMTELAVLEAPDGLQPRHMAFSPDGGMLAFNAINSHLTHVWNLRVIRERLASMGLDWNLPPYPSAPTFVYSEPLQCEIQLEPESSANGLSDPGLQ